MVISLLFLALFREGELDLDLILTAVELHPGLDGWLIICREFAHVLITCCIFLFAKVAQQITGGAGFSNPS